MNKLDLNTYAPYKCHKIDEVAGAAIRFGDGKNGIVLFNMDYDFGHPYAICMEIWDGDDSPILRNLGDSYITVEEWCEDNDYTLLHVFATNKDYILTVGELYNESGSR